MLDLSPRHFNVFHKSTSFIHTVDASLADIFPTSRFGWLREAVIHFEFWRDIKDNSSACHETCRHYYQRFDGSALELNIFNLLELRSIFIVSWTQFESLIHIDNTYYVLFISLSLLSEAWVILIWTLIFSTGLVSLTLPWSYLRSFLWILLMQIHKLMWF